MGKANLTYIADSGSKVEGYWEIFSDEGDYGGQFGDWHNGYMPANLTSRSTLRGSLC